MTQILDALPAPHPHQMLCRYSNQSPNLEVVRIANIRHWYFERVVFPHDCLLFAAAFGAILEIYSSDGITTLQTDTIPCDLLQMTASD